MYHTISRKWLWAVGFVCIIFTDKKDGKNDTMRRNTFTYLYCPIGFVEGNNEFVKSHFQ